MRILQVISDTDRRGAQVFALDLHRALAGRGHDVTTVAIRSGAGRPALAVESLSRLGRTPLCIWRLRRRMSAFDVTVAHGSSTLLACAVAAAGTERLWIYRQISDPLVWAGTPLRRFRVRGALGRATAVAALSPATAEVLISTFGVARERLSVIPNAASGASFAPADAATRAEARRQLAVESHVHVALCVGALVDAKGVEVVIRAVASSPEWVLVVAGDGPLRERLSALAEELAPGRVIFAGAVDDVAPLFHAADVFVLASRTESMPAALIEAGLCGVPAICTPAGASMEVVEDGVTGLGVPFDDAAAVACALQRLADDADGRAAMGRAAAARCRARFELDAVAGRWNELLLVCAPGGSGHA